MHDHDRFFFVANGEMIVNAVSVRIFVEVEILFLMTVLFMNKDVATSGPAPSVRGQVRVFDMLVATDGLVHVGGKLARFEVGDSKRVVGARELAVASRVNKIVSKAQDFACTLSFVRAGHACAHGLESRERSPAVTDIALGVHITTLAASGVGHCTAVVVGNQ